MGSFGERLRREREMRGIGLDEIAAATKISARNLRALEEEKFNQLPGGIFNKGFVRAYAKFLGIDQDQIVAEYETASQETESAREQKLQEDFAKAEFRKQKKDGDQEISLEPKSQWGTIAIIVLIAAIGYGGYSYYQRRKLDKLQQGQTPPPAVAQPVQQMQSPATTSSANAGTATTSSGSATSATVQTAKPGETPKPDSSKTTQAPYQTGTPADQKNDLPSASTTSKTSADQKPATSASAPFELKIKVNKEAWVSIKADGKTLVSGTLQPGTERSFKANEKIEMIVGNASGVEVSYNGRPVENLNTGQDVRKLTFTPSGYE